jgi:Flp pilus assembly protein TadD
LKRQNDGQSDQSAAGHYPSRGGFIGLLLVAVTLIAYLPVWRAGFIMDDNDWVGSSLMRQADGLYRYWCTTEAPDYFPVTSSMMWLEWRLWGEHPLGYHLVNVLLHALSAVLWWRVLRRLKIPGAWLAAAVFAVHPVNVESVAWISERKNTLAMVFFVLTLLWYLRFEDTGRRRWHGAALGAFGLGLLSKTAVAPLPLVLLGLAWWRRGRVERRDLWRSVPFFAAAAALALVTIWFQSHRAIGSTVVRADSFWSRLAGAGWAVWFYLYKAVLPVNLAFVYPRWRIAAANGWSYVPGLLVVAGLLMCWRYRRGWGKAWLFGLGYFVVLLLPILGFINVYFMRYSLVADRWQYFSIIGPIALAVAGMTVVFRRGAGFGATASWSAAALRRFGDAESARGRAQSKTWRFVVHPYFQAAFCAVLLSGLGAMTWRQCGIYTDSETLWQTTLARNPDCFLAHNNLGKLLLEKGQADAAINHFQKALALQPDFAEAHNNLGNALLQKGSGDEAIAHFQKALELQSDYANARYNLGNALVQKGRVDEAISHYQQVLKIQPGFAEAHNNLGSLLLQKGQVDEAMAHFRTALEIQPDNATAQYNLGAALLQKGQVKRQPYNQ